MQKIFTHLFADTVNPKFSKAYFTSFLLMLLLLVGNMAWAQTPVVTGPTCATATQGQDLTLTITGSGFRTTGNNSFLAVLEVNGVLPYITPSNRTTNQLTVTIPSNRITTPSITVRVRQFENANLEVFSVPFTINIYRPAAPAGVITGPANVCQGSQATFSVAPITNATTYQWSVPSSASIVGNATGNQITVNFPTVTSGNISVSGVNSCGAVGTGNTLSVTVNPALNAPTVANTTVTRCGLGEVTLISTVASGNNPAAGATNRWYSAATGGNVLATGADYIANLTSFDPLTVYVGSYNTITGCESSQRVAVTARAIQTPTATVTPAAPAAVCQGQTVLLTANASPASPAVGNYTYQWYNGNTAIGGAISATYAASASGNYSVEISTTASNCTSARSAAVAVTVSPEPTVSITPASTTICAGGSTTLTASGADTYTWAPATGLNVTSGAVVTASPATTTTYTVTAVSGGCTVTSQVTVTVNPAPIAVITQGANVILCEDGEVTLTAQTGAGYTYQWYEDGDEINGETGSTLTVDEDGEYTVQVTLNGCSVTSPVTTVTEQEAPEVTIDAGSATTFCAGNSVVLTANVDPASASYTYRWFEANNPNGNLGNAQTLTVLASGTYNVEVTLNGCTTVANNPVTVTVSQLPAATIIPEGPTDFCDGGSVILNATEAPANDVYTYQWFNGTTSIGGNTPSLVVTASGTYTVLITNSSGCQNTSEPIGIIVSTITEAAISYEEPTEFCEGGNILLSASQAPEGQTYTYQWLRNGEAITNETARTYTATESGDYSVVVSNNGCIKASAEVTVTVRPQPTAVITSGNDEACEVPGSTVSFDIAGTFTGEAAVWTSSNPNFVITNAVYDVANETATATVVVTGPGNATITLTASSTVEGCTNRASSITLLVKPLPIANITPGGATTFCQGNNVTLTADAGAGYTYQWLRNGEAVGTGSTFTASLTGSYTVTVTSNSCSVTSAPVAVTVNPLPTANIDASGSTVFCQGGSVTLTAVSDIGTSFTWFKDGAEVGTGPSFVANEAGSYTVAVAVSGTNCTSTSAPTIVTVNQPPVVSIQPSGSTTICSGSTVTFVATVTPQGTSYNYDWYNGTALVASNTTGQYTTGVAGSYTVRVSNSTTACATTSAPVTVTVNPNPVANAGGNKTVCSGQAVTLGVPAVAGYTYSWSPAVGLSSTTVAQPTLTLTNGGTSNTNATYTLTVVSNNCTSVSTAVITVTPAIANNTISGAQTLCANATPSQLTGSLPIRGNGPYTYRWESSTTSATAGFGLATGTNTGQNYNPGPVTQTTWYRRVVRSGECTESISNAVAVTVTPITTLTLVLTANPFPVCPGQQTTYTATVLANVTSVTYPTNPRYEQVTWVGGTDVSNMFTFDWWKNDQVDNQQGQTGRTVSQAGLSSTDYFTVRAKPNSNFNFTCYAFNNRPEFTVNDNNGNVLFSNRIYLGRPDNYNVTISRQPTGSICLGTPVTFTATPSAEFVNLTMEWVVRNSSGTIVATTPFTANRQFTSSTLNNGDVVSLNFTSEENKCQPVAAANSITMVVVVPQTMAGGGAYCAGGAGVPISINSSQQGVTYQLLRTVGGSTVSVGSPLAGTGGALSFGSQTAAGSYTVQPISQNGACTSAYGPVNVSVTAAPTVFGVTGGGSYCIYGNGVAVGLSGSQPNVDYQLFRTVNGSTSAVGNAVRGSGQAIGFGPQQVAGTYTVVATTVADASTAACSQSMTGSAEVQINPLPEVQLADATACSGSPATVSANVSGGGGNYTYAWQVPSGWQGAAPTTASFQTSVPGTYRVTVTDANQCASVAEEMTVAFNTPTSEEEPQLEVYWIENETKWEATASESVFGAGAFGATPTYVWYRRISTDVSSAGEWGPPVQSGGSNVYIENNPASNVQIKVEVLNSSSCILYRITNIGVAILPVEIIYLKAQKQDYDVVIEWATAMEQDNYGFEVQVSENGTNYRKLAFVEAKNRNSSVKQVYKYVDKENGKNGTRYYRLKQLDTSGKFEYFGPKVVEFGSVANNVVVYPNPFENELSLNIEAEQDGLMEIVLVNAIGKQLIRKTVMVEKGVNTEQLLVDPSLPQGVYFVTTRMGSATKHFKVIKK
ncbi:Ig-like domain-containing protein [Pontibacter sp. H249]|uniref:Ig-like domain-containing protein n=1 Tax=Pontibacter sp. H249 TaxID=3133420 RepID=UPI0030C4011A